jgi:hypothetical protein
VLLADSKAEVAVGQIELPTSLRSISKTVILEFIAGELARWRDHPDRPTEVSEDRLTEQLCDYLSGAARCSAYLDRLQFRTETADETVGGRTIDLSVKPLGATLIVEGRRCTIFDMIMPIECKRLPTPAGTRRDPREYVFSASKSTGGIQRFKQGHHGALHRLAGIIGYVQQDGSMTWITRITEWINDLIAGKESGWSDTDHLRLQRVDSASKLTVLTSVHARAAGLEEIELRHLWIEMS